ncbi:ABC transporter substrate-binding protein [Streptomyces yaanensis]|uniref:ABC transporter substrate-binding protein n=1 Tax=Streptomyces yaanensis TaxID=1142239 RepID=A0ABV7SSX1_9ACTN|nr:ABC transporter substrate-binding protein [Streptomyces sp. CGMCC 4.7035]WNB97344.1 ABC transporter substrate-binding protein [Streptomyces sp. CGMCC 4.7035]
MRSSRIRILATVLVLTGVGVGTWQLLPADESSERTITVGTTDAVTSLDPAGAYDAGSWALFSSVYQSLLTFEPDGVEPVPDAAKSCAFVGTDLRTYRCTLREGLKFPSGRAMTAEDVKYSYERVKRINSDVGPATLFATLRSVDADGLTATFHLSSPDATFPFKVATGAGAIVDHTKYPENGLRKDNAVDGTGPYLLTSYTKGKEAALAPNADYQGDVKEIGKPVVLRQYADSTALEKAWKAKAIDVATNQLPPAVLAGLSLSDTNQRVSESEGAEIRSLVLNTAADSPMHERGVRQAIASLIDRDQLVNNVYQGTTEPLYSLIPAGITGHITSFFDAYPEADASKARALLAAAGVQTPVSFTYGYVKGGGSSGAEAAELKKQLEASGLFKVDLKGYEWTAFQKQYASGKLDAYGVGWVADYPDPDTFTAPLVGTGNTMENDYSNKDVDHLILSSQRYSDRSRTDADFQKIQRAVAEDVPLIPLWQRKQYVVSSEDVGGGQYLSDGTGVVRLWRLDWI